MNIGNNIKKLRQQNNLTQDQVAEKLGVSYQAVSKWENNANTPEIALLPAIAELFGVSIDALFSNNIMDYSDIVVHIFQTEYREFYRLEDLWADAQKKVYEDQE